MSLQNASLSIANAQSISNTINANPNSISSLSVSSPSTFANSITSPVTSTVGDPIAAVLSKILSRIANTTTLTQNKINGLTSQLESYLGKNGSVQLINNTIVITVTEQNEAIAQHEKAIIDAQISSIRNVLNTLKSAISTLQSITSTINILLNLLTIQEALLTINPVSKATFTVLKQGIKILFLRDMLKSYTKVISNQLTDSQLQFSQMVSRFMNLQVSINVQQNENQGINISPDQALINLSQDLLNNGSITNVDNQSDTYIGSNGRTYILKIEQYGSNQLIAKAIDQITGQLAVQTAPGFIETPDQLLSELKSILNS